MGNEAESAEPWIDVIGPLSHELRQEVSAVLHQVELLKSSSVDELTRRRSLGAIEDNAEHLMAFVDDLTRLGRVTRGQVSANCRQVDVDDLVARSGRDRSRQIEWTVAHDCSEVWSIQTDPLIIDHIVTGLLDRYDRDGLDADAVVSAFVLRSTDGCLDVVFTTDRSRPIEPAFFRPATLDDGLSLYLARRTAELIGADVGVLQSGRRDSYLLRLPEAQPTTTL